MTAPLICRNCGDLFTAPKRPCPKPSPGRPLYECGRGGHMFFPAEPPPPPEPMTAQRLQEIAALVERAGTRANPHPASPAGIIPALLAEVYRLRAECAAAARRAGDRRRVHARADRSDGRG
jgi:hypothetical protein